MSQTENELARLKRLLAAKLSLDEPGGALIEPAIRTPAQYAAKQLLGFDTDETTQT